MRPSLTLYISLLLYRTPFEDARACIDALLNQSLDTGALLIDVHDNSESPETFERLKKHFSAAPQISWRFYHANLGFSGGHNRAATDFLASHATHFITLNADVVLDATALARLVGEFQKVKARDVGAACIKLRRATPQSGHATTIDAAGMVMHHSLRHFDRGGGQPDRGQYDTPCYVFGGTGACLMLTRACMSDLLLPAEQADSPVFTLYPQLRERYQHRAQLFDEAFFAYREDAELAWRMQRLGWRCLYVPQATGTHRRAVTPEKRSSLPAVINALGVRNRFLLQLSHYEYSTLKITCSGLIMRNVAVVLGVFLLERSSLSALREVIILLPRMLRVRRYLKTRAQTSSKRIARWFMAGEYVEFE
jgi:GT2 family glycosyltransferase